MVLKLHVLGATFPGGHSSFSLWIIHLPPPLPPFIVPLIYQCDRYLVPLEWELIVGRRGFTGADPGFFLGGGALVSCSTSTPINHIVFFFFSEYQLY